MTVTVPTNLPTKPELEWTDILLPSGATLRVEPMSAHIFRLRIDHQGRFKRQAINRYGIVRDKHDPVAFQSKRDETNCTVQADHARLRVGLNDGRIEWCDANGNTLTTLQVTLGTESGYDVRFAIDAALPMYGLGDASRAGVDRRGTKVQMWVVNEKCYMPVPFVMTKGWGAYLNTTWRHNVDIGADDASVMRLWGADGEFDMYLFAGQDPAGLLERYTFIVGRPALLPRAAYGLTWVCNQNSRDRDLLEDGLGFRREGIPCDTLGLEPGWMSKYYDTSVDKAWHPERFNLPTWNNDEGREHFITAARRMGFGVSLWLCCNYDLTHHEEQQAQNDPLNNIATENDAALSAGPNLASQDEKLRWAHRLDSQTKPQEPWFDHLKKFVDQGVAAFKMDGAFQVPDHPDRFYGNGMNDEEAHNLSNVLLYKQMSLGFSQHTGKRAFIYGSGGYTGLPQYAASWTGDTLGGEGPLAAMLNHGLSGHSNLACDMDIAKPPGIHFGFFQAWSQICNWAYWRQPWYSTPELCEMTRFYAKLRYRLLPYIYSLAHEAHRSGMPIMRAMALAYPDDAACAALRHQWMFGPAFLVAAFTDKIYLPQGQWTDYWTGIVHQGPCTLPVKYPENRGGVLFVRHGAIIPCAPDMAFGSQKPLDQVTLEIYPHTQSSAFSLIEDDGITFGYQHGEMTTTQINCTLQSSGAIELTIAPRQGSYPGLDANRAYRVHIHHAPSPTAIWVNDHKLSQDHWNVADHIIRIDLPHDAASAGVKLYTIV